MLVVDLTNLFWTNLVILLDLKFCPEDFKFLTFLKSQFQARSTIPRQGSDTDAVLSRSEAFLKTNDLEKSLFELTQLDGIALKFMEPWRISAENRINSLLAVEQLVQSIEK